MKVGGRAATGAGATGAGMVWTIWLRTGAGALWTIGTGRLRTGAEGMPYVASIGSASLFSMLAAAEVAAAWAARCSALAAATSGVSAGATGATSGTAAGATGATAGADGTTGTFVAATLNPLTSSEM